ncbi:hypothetical protein ACV33D_29915, partial [Pseudomonas aeruginosa]
KAILRLAGPLIAAQLAYVAMVFTDTVMMGKLGPDALAAGGQRVGAELAHHHGVGEDHGDIGQLGGDQRTRQAQDGF